MKRRPWHQEPMRLRHRRVRLLRGQKPIPFLRQRPIVSRAWNCCRLPPHLPRRKKRQRKILRRGIKFYLTTLHLCRNQMRTVRADLALVLRAPVLRALALRGHRMVMPAFPARSHRRHRVLNRMEQARRNQARTQFKVQAMRHRHNPMNAPIATVWQAQ